MRAVALTPLVALSLASAACHATPEATTDTRPAIAVISEAAVVTEVHERLEAGGVVTAATSAAVSSRVLAPVVELRVRAGDRVRAGQVLVVLDDRDLSAHARQAQASLAAGEQGLAAARAELTAAEAEQQSARAWHGRMQTLHAKRAATLQELDDAKSRLATAEARVEGARARIRQAEAGTTATRASADAAAATWSFATVRAPFDGLVTETLTEPGNLAAPGTPLLRLDSSGPLRVEVLVDEARATYVHAGDRVEVQLESDGRAGLEESRPTETPWREGVVVEVARTISADRRAFTVKVTIPGERAARTGTFARVRFPGASRHAVTVPATAVRRQGQVSTVFVIQEGTARLRLVQTGQTHDGRVEVLAGVDAGEPLVANPSAALTDGQRVTVGARSTSAGQAGR